MYVCTSVFDLFKTETGWLTGDQDVWIRTRRPKHLSSLSGDTTLFCDQQELLNFTNKTHERPKVKTLRCYDL